NLSSAMPSGRRCLVSMNPPSSSPAVQMLLQFFSLFLRQSRKVGLQDNCPHFVTRECFPLHQGLGDGLHSVPVSFDEQLGLGGLVPIKRLHRPVQRTTIIR